MPPLSLATAKEQMPPQLVNYYVKKGLLQKITQVEFYPSEDNRITVLVDQVVETWLPHTNVDKGNIIWRIVELE